MSKPTPTSIERQAVGVAVGVSSAVAFPVVLVGALAVQLQRELGFGETQLGGAIAAYFTAAALSAWPGGWITERLGPRTTALLGLACAAVSLLGIALLVGSWMSLVPFLALGGLGNTFGQLGVNLLVVRSVSSEHRGLAFGAKQAGIPLAALGAGLAVPSLALTFGWRWAFALAALAAPLCALLMPRGAGMQPRSGISRRGDAPLATLALLTIGVALASAGGTSTATFIVASSVDRGLTPAAAGLVLAVGSFVGLSVRVFGGWLGDRLRRGSLLLVASLIAIGAIGFLGLAAADRTELILVFAILAFGGGWGWGGLLLLALSRSNPSAPAAAMGIVQIGPMTGAMAGPLVFGLLAEHVGFPASWLLMSVLAAIGVAAILTSRQQIVGARSAARDMGS